jgi:hypothetical protein
VSTFLEGRLSKAGIAGLNANTFSVFLKTCGIPNVRTRIAKPGHRPLTRRAVWGLPLYFTHLTSPQLGCPRVTLCNTQAKTGGC